MRFGFVRHVAVDERVRLPAFGERGRARGGAAGVLDEVDVALVVRVDAFIAAAAEEGMERVDLHRPVDRELDDAAAGAGLLGEQQRVGERVVGAAVDRPEPGLVGGRIDRCEQRDALRAAARHVEVDARHIGERRAVLVALIEEVAPVIEAGGRSAGIVAEHEIEVLIGLRQHIGAEQAELGDRPARILERLGAGRDQLQLKIGVDPGRGSPDMRVGGGNAGLDLPAAVVGVGCGGNEYRCKSESRGQAHHGCLPSGEDAGKSERRDSGCKHCLRRRRGGLGMRERAGR
jgi:hypothetical protein